MEYSEKDTLDSLDRAILRILQTEGRVSNVDLAGRVNLSPPAVHARIKRLEQRGFIQGYAGLLNREKLGYDMLCFINVTLQLHHSQSVENFKAAIQSMPEVLECHHVTGKYDYLLKVVVRNRKDLQRFVVDRLTPTPGLAHIHTSLVLSEVKYTTALPIDESGAAKNAS